MEIIEIMSTQIISSQDDFWQTRLWLNLSALRILRRRLRGLHLGRNKVWTHQQQKKENIHRFREFPLHIPSEYFLCHNSQGGNLAHLLTWDDKEEGLEKLPRAAVKEPRGVWLVNIDKRQQRVLTRDLCLPVPCGLCLRKVVRRLDWHLSGYTAVSTGELWSLNQWESLQIKPHTKGFFRHAEKTDAELNCALWVGF